jgi:hypothetical protein
MSDGCPADEQVEAPVGIIGRRVSIAGVDEIVSFHSSLLLLRRTPHLPNYSHNAAHPCPNKYMTNPFLLFGYIKKKV